ncbi:MAG: choice-of-anchor Q domain-containing protein, partial [Calditrichia bacterium]
KITVASLFIIDGDTNHINNTIIDGSQPSYPDSGSVVYFVSGEDTTSTLCGFTITGGSGTIIVPGIIRGSGGIHCSNAGPKICHNRIINNSVTSTFYEALGGGIGAGPLTSNAFIVVEDNLIQSNTTIGDEFAFGGGIFLTINARISGNRILDNIVSAENQQAWGGGIGTENADSVIVTGNIVLRNKAQTNSNTELADGGGMFFLKDSAAFVRIIGNRIAYNEIKSDAFQGGAGVGIDQIGYSGGDVLFANNRIYKNKYTGLETCHGGGLYLNRSIVRVINNTFTGNIASFGGGISCSHSDSTTLFMNNICWGDTATQSPGEIDLYLSSPPIFVYNDIQGGWPGEGNIDADPQFVAGDSLWHLSSNSPCIDAGIDSIFIGGHWYYCPPEDYEGEPRPMGIAPDIGADEFFVVGIEPQPTVGIPQSYVLTKTTPTPSIPQPLLSSPCPTPDL